MKNSFYLVIPEQQEIPERVRLFEEKALQNWIEELPVANPGLSTRLLFDLLKEFNSLKMDVQSRLDALELLKATIVSTEEYLRFRLIKEGFPKSGDEQKIFNVLVEIEKEFTLGYWIVVKSLTRREISWFKGKNVTLAIQRAIAGLNHIVVTHYMMGIPVPDWVWFDIHSLHRLSVKIKKVSVKIPKNSGLTGKGISVSDCYRQIMLLSLAEPSGLMQKEVLQVFNFIESLSSLLALEDRPIQSQPSQCVVLTDEDQEPRFIQESNINPDSSALYINFSKLNKVLEIKEKFIDKNHARFSSLAIVKNNAATLPAELLDYLLLRWNGIILKGMPLFADRLDRYMCVGLETTYQLLLRETTAFDEDSEFLVQSTSETALSCRFHRTGVISIGSLISFRKKDLPAGRRALGVINKILAAKPDGTMNFEIQALAGQVFAVTFSTLTAKDQPQKALIYGVKTNQGDKSYIILDSFNLKEGDVIRMTLNQETFPIILRDKRNIGLGYWQYECRRLEEHAAAVEQKKGFDFI